MAEFNEDMIFKNIAEEDVDILLEIVNKPSKFKRIWTTELRQIDPSTYKPDLIIELDKENLIIEFQSTKVNKKFSQRANVYVAVIDQKKKNKPLIHGYSEENINERTFMDSRRYRICSRTRSYRTYRIFQQRQKGYVRCYYRR